MRVLFFLWFVGVVGVGFAQRPGAVAEVKGEIFGNIIDSIGGEAIPYATVMAMDPATDKMVAGAVTKENGSFSLANLPLGTYKLKISTIGYTTKFVEKVVLSETSLTYNLKDFKIYQKALDVVEIEGKAPDITYEIDKKVVNVEDQINTEGQSAIEILRNVPSVSVGADGSITLRGSAGFTLLIDGIPTIMDASDALASIPASNIKNIEIITNPSAKFDAEGTSGVINIITKKSKLEGISCLVNLSAGRFNNYSGDVALNFKKNNFIFDISGQMSNRSRPSETNTERTTTYDSLVNRLVSVGNTDWSRSSNGFGGGIQWNPNNSHVFQLNTDIKWNQMLPYSDFRFSEYIDDSLVSEFSNFQNNNIDMFNNTSSLYYQYNIKRNVNHNVSFKAIYNNSDVVQNDTTLSYNQDGGIRAGNLYTETGPSGSWRFNVDYKLPLKKDRKFEAGLQAQFGSSGDIGKNYTYNSVTETFDFNPLFSSDVEYVRDIHAGYTMFSGKYKKLGYQLGLRAEYTYQTISTTAAVDYLTIDQLDWFPSAHFSYSLKNKSQLLVSYSRRIERPRSYFFEPFITWDDPYNVRTGNPNLLAEYINAFEVSFMKPFKSKGFASVEVYARQSNNIINRISSVYEPGILITQPYNIGVAQSIGLEGSLSYDIKKYWKINAGANAFYFILNGNLNGVDYGRESFNYSARLTNTFTFKGYMLQFVSAYESGSVTAQGESLGSFSQDISLKKSFMKNKLSVTLMGRNILGTERSGSTSTTQNVFIETLSKPFAPQIMLSVALKFNNYQKVADRNEQMDDF